MAEFSSLVAVFIDPDTGAPSSLQALVDGDTVASSVFDPATRRTLETVVDSSSSWEAGLDADTYNNLVITSGRAEDMVTFSASVQVSAANLDTSTRDVIASSTDISAYIEANEGGWNAGIDAGTLNDLISVSGSTVSLSGSVGNTSSIFNDRPNIIITSGRAEDMVTFSADVQSSAAILDTSVTKLITDLSTNVYTNSGTWESGGGGGADPFDPDDLVSLSGSVISISGTVTDGSAIFNDRPSLISISGSVGDTSSIFNDRPNIVITSGRAEDMVTFSANVETSTTVLDTSVTKLITDLSTNVYTNSGTWESGGGGGGPDPFDYKDLESVSGSVISISGTVNDGSAIFEDRPSLISISGTTTAVSSSVFTASANWDTAYGDRDNNISVSGSMFDGSANWTTIYNDRPNITSVSGSVLDSSANWDTAYGDRGNNISVSGSMFDGSANWTTIYNDRPNITSVSGAVLDSSANWDTAYGDRGNNISVSGTTFDGSANWTTIYNDRPNIISVSGSTLDGSANWTTIYNDRPNIISVSGSTLDGSANWTTIYNDRPNIISVSGSTLDGSANWTTIYNDRPNIISVSGSVDASNTAFLNGTTPTLSNNLNADGNSLNNVPIIYGNNNLTLQSKNSSQRGIIDIRDNMFLNGSSMSGVGEILGNAPTGNITVSGGTLRLLHLDDPAASIIIGKAGSVFSTNDFAASAKRWNSVFDTTYSTADGSSTWTGGGGGGTTIEEPHVQGGIVFASGTGGTAGYGNTAAGTGGQYLQSNGTGTPFFSVIRTNQLKNPLGASPAVGSLILGNGTTYYEDATIANTSGTWDTAYGDRANNISVSGSVLDNSANWNTAYTSATNTTDVSSIFSGNINVIGTTPSHSGTIGTTNAGTYGLETTGNCSIIAPSIILSATTAYQFRKNGSTTFTDTDFPQSCRDWDSNYTTVLNNSGTWGGGGGGGGVAAGITIVNTGTDNINSTTGALIPLDTSTGFPAYGTYGTDYSYTAGNSYVTINTAGTYEVTFNVAYTTVTARWNGILKIYKGTGGASPSAWIGYGAGKMGYVRNSTGHNEASLIVTCLVTCSANDTIGGHVINEAANGTCTTVANESYMTIKRMS